MRRAMLFALALATLCANGCSVTYPEGVLACTLDSECPSGWTCRATRCYSTAGLDATVPEDANPDAPLVDAGPPDAPPVDLGCPATGPTNADCPWHFGRPHAVPSLQPNGGLFSAAVLGGGLKIYVSQFGGPADAPFYEATRAGAAATFGNLLPTLGSQNTGVTVYLLSMTDDGLEVFAQTSDTRSGAAVTHILRYVRPNLASEFGSPGSIGAVEMLGATVHPSITGDGLELFFVAGISGTGERIIYSTRRASRDASFELAAPVGLPAGLESPRVTPDGLGLFAGVPAQYASRADRRSAFGAPAVLPNAGPLAAFAFPTYVPATRELWYASGMDGSQAPWSPTLYALWRVQVCRDGPCPPEPHAMDCPPGSPESADGFHCYFTGPARVSWGGATDACGTGAYVASVHSAEEAAVVGGLLGSTTPVWLGASKILPPGGAFRWSSGERFLYTPWAPGAPDGSATSECIQLFNGMFDDIACATLVVPACERSVWPIW